MIKVKLMPERNFDDKSLNTINKLVNIAENIFKKNKNSKINWVLWIQNKKMKKELI